MSLIHCPDCSAETSTAAPNCPHCGRPIARPPTEMLGLSWPLVILFVGVGLLFVPNLLVAGLGALFIVVELFVILTRAGRNAGRAIKNAGR